jgi:hypothetical protein
MEWFNLGLAEPQTYNQAKLLAEAVGYNPEQAKVVAAQWQMESAGGSRLSSAYNYFGIKSHNEAVRNKLAERGIDVSAGKEAATKEGAGKASKASFMEFNNAFEGFAAHKAFLETNQRYAKALNSDTAKDFAVGLERAGYATAPNYGTTLYQDYVAPKEKNPKSGDTRPKSLGETKSEKIKPFTQSFEPTPELTKLPVLAPQRLEVEPQIDLNPTTGTGMYGSTSYQPEITPTKAVPLSANAGFFGSGKSSFNMGGLMNSYKNGGFNNPGFNALPVEVQDRIKARSYAAGGPMAGPLTEFNAGGSHEESSLGGIPQGMAPDGRMNLVEQGETKLDSANYIFSDRLKLTKEIAKGANLPAKFVGKTFADVSKSLNLPKSRRENDSIENNYKEKMLDELVQAQELHKQEEMAKDFAMMAEKYPEQMAAMMQQSVAPPMPMPGEAVAAGMNPAQEMPSPEPVPSSQLPMSYGGSMYACGGKMYDAGGTMRAIGAGAYGVGEGMLDTLTFGLTDSITDKGFDKLSEMGGGRTQEEMNREKMLRGFGNTAGAITGAVVSGGAATGSAISEGSEGAAQGLTNIKGTNAKFDATVNSLGQMGSMVGGLVGGNPTEAATSGAPQFAQTLMGAANNPMVQQGASMVSSFMANGGHLYPQINPMWKNNAGPMGQPLTNMYAAGGELFMDPAAMGGPGGPGTPTTPATPASPTLPDIMYYTPTFDGMSASDYGKKYKKDLQEYFNNPKDKSGIPMHGIASGWTPVDPANITNKIAAIEKMPAADLNDSILQEYLTLKNTPKEYFVD